MFVAGDESREGRYWVVGTAWIPSEELPAFEERVTRLRLETGCWGEFKWNKTANSVSTPIYRSFLKEGFAIKELKMHLMVIDTNFFTQAGLRLFHPTNGKNEAFFKLYRALLKSHAIRYAGQPGFDGLHIIYDKLPHPALTVTFQRVVRNDIGSRLIHLGPCDSHLNSLLQFVDLITGATASVWNQVRRSSYKESLVTDIEKWAGLGLIKATLPNRSPLSIWFWTPRGTPPSRRA